MYVLVIARDRNVRQLYVNNLVIRGYLAVGVPSLREATRILAKDRPVLVMVCQIPRVYEPQVADIRAHSALATAPLVLINHDAADAKRLRDRYNLVSLAHPADVHDIIGLIDRAQPASAGRRSQP